ncbi:MAG: 50S ribosomal protein L24 [Phycisphaerae bacterium]|nr:50S ribosomal protein L24 [Phycisphaerae bacterium]
MAARIRKDDLVQVISGEHRGARGKVLRLVKDGDRVIIEGVNMVYKHLRPSRQAPQGGRVQREASIHISNVLPVDPATGKPTRVRFRTEVVNGKVVAKQRVSVKGTVLGDVKRHERAAKTK